MTDRALQLLRRDARLAALAAFPFDFDLTRADHVEEVRLASGGPLEPVAGDDTGGTYFVCADGSVLYADSEGAAGLIGNSVDEALEILIGLPGRLEYVDLAPGDGEEHILARIAETEEEIRESYGIDAERTELRTALGLPERPPVELVTRLHAALLRTEPDFLLLNAEEGGAYRLLEGHRRPPLWETVLAPGRADLSLLREGRSWDEVAHAPARRALALRAAQYDRRDSDLALLRHLLRHEADASMTDELRLAAVLVGLHGRTEDLPLLHEARETTYDTYCGLGGMPEPGADGDALRAWAQGLDDSLFGTDPSDEPSFTWTDLAQAQGRDELVRVTLIRALDEIDLRAFVNAREGRRPGSSDADELNALAHRFERLGDSCQALRAQRLYVALQGTAQSRVPALLKLARLERDSGHLPSAIRALARLREGLAEPADGPSAHWRGTNLGVFVVEEHDEVAAAAGADGSLAEEVREVTEAASGLLAELSEAGRAAVRRTRAARSPAG
ncbi:hypothetical protein [Streptomyces sp. NPDC058371]|uniref:hypothetical protein n=1 Tax=Streptomyces sp. NPDC058371 TaxID=3346463 RepID=UPI00364E3A26